MKTSFRKKIGKQHFNIDRLGPIFSFLRPWRCVGDIFHKLLRASESPGSVVSLERTRGIFRDRGVDSIQEMCECMLR